MKNKIFPHKCWRPFLDCMPQLLLDPNMCGFQFIWRVLRRSLWQHPYNLTSLENQRPIRLMINTTWSVHRTGDVSYFFIALYPSPVVGNNHAYSAQLYKLTHSSLRDMAIILYEHFCFHINVKLPSGECHKTSLMISQLRFRQWLGAIMRQAIIWANI